MGLPPYDPSLLEIDILGEDNSAYGSVYKISFTRRYLETLRDDTLCIRDFNGNPVKQILLKVSIF